MSILETASEPLRYGKYLSRITNQVVEVGPDIDTPNGIDMVRVTHPNGRFGRWTAAEVRRLVEDGVYRRVEAEDEPPAPAASRPAEPDLDGEVKDKDKTIARLRGAVSGRDSVITHQTRRIDELTAEVARLKAGRAKGEDGSEPDAVAAELAEIIKLAEIAKNYDAVFSKLYLSDAVRRLALVVSSGLAGGRGEER